MSSTYLFTLKTSLSLGLAGLFTGSHTGQPIHFLTDTVIHAEGNPIIKHKYTADPGAMVYKGKVYIYAGHDEAPKAQARYVMHDWLCFSSPDMVTWTEPRYL
jgi:hypothetical protein